jgi:hypothetical protein
MSTTGRFGVSTEDPENPTPSAERASASATVLFMCLCGAINSLPRPLHPTQVDDHRRHVNFLRS